MTILKLHIKTCNFKTAYPNTVVGIYYTCKIVSTTAV